METGRLNLMSWLDSALASGSGQSKARGPGEDRGLRNVTPLRGTGGGRHERN